MAKIYLLNLKHPIRRAVHSLECPPGIHPSGLLIHIIKILQPFRDAAILMPRLNVKS